MALVITFIVTLLIALIEALVEGTVEADRPSSPAAVVQRGARLPGLGVKRLEVYGLFRP